MNKLFYRYIKNDRKLKEYGFIDNDGIYSLSIPLMNNKLSLNISIGDDINYTLFDNRLNEECISKSNTILELVKNELLKIRDNCFIETTFVFPQSNRIDDYFKNEYGILAEFPWDTLHEAGIYRSKYNDKWYAIIMRVEYIKLGIEKEGLVEVMNLKNDDIDSFINNNGIYKAYHMNKKHWISITLDETVKDAKIIELILESIRLVDRKR